MSHSVYLSKQIYQGWQYCLLAGEIKRHPGGSKVYCNEQD